MIEHAPKPLEPVSAEAARTVPTIPTFEANGLTSVANQVKHWLEVDIKQKGEAGLTWAGPDGKMYVCRGSGQEVVDAVDPITGSPAVVVTRERQKVLHSSWDRSDEGHNYRLPWKKAHQKLTNAVDTRYVDVYENDPKLGTVLVGTEAYQGSKWAKKLEEMKPEKDGETTPFWLTANAEVKPRGTHRIDVDDSYVQDGKKKLSQVINRTVRKEDLHDWSGLCVTVPVKNGALEQMVILRDLSFVQKGITERPVTERVFEVQVYEGSGKPGSRRELKRVKMKAVDFMHMIDIQNSTDVDAHFEVDKNVQDDRKNAEAIGFRVFDALLKDHPEGGKVVEPYPGSIPKLDQETAAAWLLGIDPSVSSALTPDEKTQCYVELNKMMPEDGLTKILPALMELSERFGTEYVKELAERMDSNYRADARRIGLYKKHQEPEGTIWALHDLAEHWYVARDDRLAAHNPELAGGTPWGFNDDARAKQQEIIDRHIGRTFESQLVERVPTKKKIGIDPKTGLDITKDAVRLVRDDDMMRDMKNLKQLEHNVIDPIVDQMSNEKPNLTYEEEVIIGATLRKAYAH
jgi:hypothetical protein